MTKEPISQEHYIRAAFAAGLRLGLQKHDEYVSLLPTHYGIDLQCDYVHDGLKEFNAAIEEAFVVT